MIRLLIFLILVSPVIAEEKLALDEPLNASSGASSLRPSEIHFSYARQSIEVIFAEVDGDNQFVNEGETVSCLWTQSQEALSTLQSLNTSNMSSKSLNARLMEEAQDHGCLPSGSIAGDPE